MRAIRLSSIGGLAVCIFLLCRSAEAYHLRTHGSVTDQSFATSQGLARYLDAMDIRPGDVFDSRAITPFAQLAEFSNNGTARGWMIEGAIREDDFQAHLVLARLGCPQPKNPHSDIDRPKHHFFDIQRGGAATASPRFCGGERSWYEAYTETAGRNQPYRPRGDASRPLVLVGYAPVSSQTYQDYWANAEGSGLAEFSSRNFFSAGTNLGTFYLAGPCGGLVEPVCDRRGDRGRKPHLSGAAPRGGGAAPRARGFLPPPSPPPPPHPGPN